MPFSRAQFFLAACLSVALHAGGLFWAWHHLATPDSPAEKPKPPERVIVVTVPPPPPPPPPPPSPPKPTPPAPAAVKPPAPKVLAAAPASDRAPASMEAPAAPTAEEWALAATYTLKNSKRYRHNWGQQVRSMMGTAVEGPDQGVVRFRIEIAPNGHLARVDTLWTTSATVEQRARQAIENMPPLPPTPTGQPLIFEKTIAFQAFHSEDPPVYRNDCEPDPPSFRNPFAWDGQSPRLQADTAPRPQPLDPQALAECLKQLPQDSIEAEQANDQRQLEQWASPTLKEVPR